MLINVRGFFLVLLIGNTMGCSGKAGNMVAMNIKNTVYSFPNDLIADYTLGKPDGSGAFIRLMINNPKYIIEFSERNYITSTGKEKFPIIPHISTAVPVSDLTLSKIDGYDVLCSPLSSGIHFTCGISIIINNAKWSIRFDHSEVANISVIVKSANSYLTKFRQA